MEQDAIPNVIHTIPEQEEEVFDDEAAPDELHLDDEEEEMVPLATEANDALEQQPGPILIKLDQEEEPFQDEEILDTDEQAKIDQQQQADNAKSTLRKYDSKNYNMKQTLRKPQQDISPRLEETKIVEENL